MSLRINTNVSALTAMRHLAATDAMMSRSITRLSTGLKINSAGDDPAGLIISEGMRSTIKGIEQAIRNTQDGVNMVKTAEAAMDEVQTLLRDIRGLAVHSSNSAVVDATMLEANQTQIRSIIDSINRVAGQTAWGEKKLLNGASGVNVGVTQTGLVNSLFLGGEVDGETVRTGSVTIQRVTAATQTTTGAMATNFASATTAVNAGTFVINGQTFVVQTGETVGQVVAKINQMSSVTGVVADVVGTGPVQVRLTSSKYGSNFPINYMETSTILNGGNPATPAVGVDAEFDVTVPVEPSPDTATERFTGGRGPGVDGLTLSSPSGNRMVISPAGNATAAATVVGQVTVGSLRFQIGANADQAAFFSLPSVFADDLGTSVFAGESVATIDVTTQQGAQEAMRIVEAAIQQLAGSRGKLGSFQKDFLESTVRSLGVAQENMTASESQIRDADIAEEMTEFTKVQILRQSGISVLAQANQAPQSVLQLLRGG